RPPASSPFPYTTLFRSYSGSRDGFFRIISYDGDEPKELWRLDGNSVQPKYGDDDWDSSGLVIDDYLFQNSENGNFHIIKLNRGRSEEHTSDLQSRENLV